MSYCRLPHYIYPTGYGINFLSSNAEVSNDEIDIFLYKIFLTRRDEFIKRVEHGKKKQLWSGKIMKQMNITIMN